MSNRKGWFNEPGRHSLASKGIPTSTPNINELADKINKYMTYYNIRDLTFVNEKDYIELRFELKAPHSKSIESNKSRVKINEMDEGEYKIEGNLSFPNFDDGEEALRRAEKVKVSLDRLGFDTESIVQQKHNVGMYSGWLSFEKKIPKEKLYSKLNAVYYAIEKYYEGGGE